MSLRRQMVVQGAPGEPAAASQGFEKLWTEHVTRTREFIKAAVAKDPRALLAAAGPLLKNQIDLGAAFAPRYGKEFGDKAAFLLEEHILLFGSLILAALREDREAGRLAAARLDENAERIAEVLSSVNPHWPKDIVLNLLRDHLSHTVAELDALVVGDKVGDERAWAEVRKNAAEIAKALAEGLKEQAEKAAAPAPTATSPKPAQPAVVPPPIRVFRKPAVPSGGT